jgi:2-polyprenyl-6-methoxyphenol hydroxylase-like FAD-dependent oxidoreductase
MANFEHDVIVAGGGPTGMMLAGELALAGADVALVERRVNQTVEGSRAGGLHSRSLEILDQRGLADRFVAQGTRHHAVPFAGTILDAADLPSRHNYTLGLWQEAIERGLAEWVADLAVTAWRGCEVTGFTEDEAGVLVQLNDGRSLRAKYLVGCDGGRSLVRKAAGIGFVGWEPTVSSLIFEAEMADDPPLGVRYGERGTCAVGRLEDGRRIRGVVVEPQLELGDTASEARLREALIAAYGSDFGLHDVTWLSRFTDAARQAVAYRKGRVLLAGDAAHVHSPVGGQGLNIGLQDAVNLGWKLAQVVRGISGDSLLDTYHAERHQVGAELLRTTLALSALTRGGDRVEALRQMLSQPMQMDGPRRWYAARMAGLDIRYDLGGDHPLVGCRMPDLDIVTADGPTRVFALLHEGPPVLLDLGSSPPVKIDGWADRVQRVKARFDGLLELPVIGPLPAPAAVLIRPDGHVAWVGDGRADGLAEALSFWFGPRA